jgi:hypothetical protein
VYLTLDQNERDQLTKYRMNISFYLYSSHLFVYTTGTLLEAAGLLLSIAFHWGITAAFNVPKQLCISKNSTLTSWLNNSMIDSVTDVTTTPITTTAAATTVAANVVIIKDFFILYLLL